MQNSSKQEEVVIPGKRSPAPHGAEGEARPGIQSRRRRDSSNSVPPWRDGFRRNDGISDFCKKLRSLENNYGALQIENCKMQKLKLMIS